MATPTMREIAARSEALREERRAKASLADVARGLRFQPDPSVFNPRRDLIDPGLAAVASGMRGFENELRRGRNGKQIETNPMEFVWGDVPELIGRVASGQSIDPLMAAGAVAGLTPIGKGTKVAKAAVKAGEKVAEKGEKQVLKRLEDEFPDAESAEIAATTPVPLKARKREVPRDTGMARTFKSGEKEGIIRGSEGFGGLTVEDAKVLQDNYVKKANKGVVGKYWYDNTSKDLYRVAGEDVPMADKLTEVAASTSSRTPVGANLMYTNRGHNQWLASDPVHTGGFPKRMSREIENIMENDAQASGFKRSPYAGGLAQHWRPDPDLRPVHDIHDVRGHGILDPKTGKLWSKGVSEAGHRVLDDQTAGAVKTLNRQAKAKIAHARKSGMSEEEIASMTQDDWNNYRAQAATWTTQRAEKDGIPLEEAGKHYGDYIDDYSALITREHQPGKTTGHAQELLTKPRAVQDEFADAMESAVTGPGGIDAIAHDLGALSDKTLRNEGVYEGVSAPGFTSRILVGKGKGVDDIDDSSMKLMNYLASTHGLFGVQDQVAHNFISGKEPILRGGAIQFKRGKDQPFTKEELERLRDMNIGADIPQVDPQGARALVFTDPATQVSKATQKQTLKAGPPERDFMENWRNYTDRTDMMTKAREVAKDFGADVEMRHRSGNLFPMDENYNAPAKWSAKPFIEEIEKIGPRGMEKWNEKMPARAAKILEQFEQQAAKHGITDAPYYKPMLEGVIRGGMPELKRLVAAGIVPVSALGMFGLSQMMDEGEGVQ